MNEIFGILTVIIIGLFGINVMKSRKINSQKKEIKKQEAQIGKKKEEMNAIHEAQTKIEEIKKAPKPEEKETPESGDYASRLERLNKLHEH